MTLEEATEKIKEKVGEDCGLDAKVKFLLEGEHVIYVDSTKVPNEVTNTDAEADTTIKMKMATFEKILTGQSNPMNAFMMGKIKVDGNMGIAMNINKII